MDCIVHGVAKSQTRLGVFHFRFIPLGFSYDSDSQESSCSAWKTWVWYLGEEDPLEKRMATHSSILACRIPWTQEPGGLQSMGSQRVGHGWTTNTFTVFHRPLEPMLLHCGSQGLMHQNYQQSLSRDFPGGGPVAKTLSCQCRGTGFHPWSGSKLHMLQLWGYMLQLKILHAATETEDPACHK